MSKGAAMTDTVGMGGGGGGVVHNMFLLLSYSCRREEEKELFTISTVEYNLELYSFIIQDT